MYNTIFSSDIYSKMWKIQDRIYLKAILGNESLVWKQHGNVILIQEQRALDKR